jgi:PAS domain S-box-containing protein
LIFQGKWIEPLMDWRLWVPPAVMSVFLVGVAQYSFLGFHTFAELFAIVISFVMFALAWSTYDFSKNNFLLFLACGFFWVGSLDLMHTLVYKGMDVFVEGSGNLAVQFWIGTRYSEALLLLAAPFAATREQNRYLLFAVFGFVAVGLTILILSGQFPAGFVEGQGLTDFKVYSEYLIISVLALSLVVLLRYGHDIPTQEKTLIAVSIVMTMCAELAFTFYISMHGIPVIAGHIFKIFSFWLIFQAIVIANLHKPYAALKRSEAHKHDILKNALDAIFFIDEDGLIVDANPAAERIFGYTGGELLGKNVADHIIPPDLREMHLDALARLKKTGKGNIIGQRFETRALKSDGAEFPIELTLSQTTIGNQRYFTGFIRDMSERALADEQLRKLSLAVEQSPASVVITDLSGTIEYVNSKFVEVTGYRPDDAIGRNPRMLKSGLNPPEIYKDLWEKLTSGREWRGLLCNRKKNGDLFWESATIAPLIGPEGETTHYIAVKEDITERRLTEEALRKAQKMDAVGKLAGGIAHDFNNILGIVMGNLEILQRLVADDPKALGRVETALKGARRGARLTTRLLGFSSLEAGDREVASVNEIIADLDDFIKRSLTKKIEVEFRLADDIWSVDVDPGDLGDSIVNLAINARDAMPDGGTLIIETANRDLDEHFSHLNPEVSPGEYVMVSVQDTGTGMTREVMDLIFDPFFSTKEKDKGTGLGLAMVYGFVKRSSGNILVHSEPGHGSEFQIFLPRSLRSRDRVRASGDVVKALPRGDETILVVDDEKEIIEIAVNHLTELGYRTITANNGRHALEALKRKDKVDLLFTDVIMPGGTDGFQLACRARQEHPELKILLTSGFAEMGEKSKNQNDPLIAKLKGDLLSKPYDKKELAENVRRILDENG